MSEDIRMLRAVHGSARADGNAEFGRVSFRLSGTPERRWSELFEANKDKGFTTEERANEFLVHVECAPGEVAHMRDAAAALIWDVNSRWRAEVTAQHAKARERHDHKLKVEAALNQELELLNFDRT